MEEFFCPSVSLYQKKATLEPACACAVDNSFFLNMMENFQTIVKTLLLITQKIFSSTNFSSVSLNENKTKMKIQEVLLKSSLDKDNKKYRSLTLF